MLSVNHPIGAGEGPGGPACGPSGPYCSCEGGWHRAGVCGGGRRLAARRQAAQRTRLVAHTGPVAHAVMHCSAARSSLSRTTESPGHRQVGGEAVHSVRREVEGTEDLAGRLIADPGDRPRSAVPALHRDLSPPRSPYRTASSRWRSGWSTGSSSRLPLRCALAGSGGRS